MAKITAQQVANLRPGSTMQRVQIDTGLQLRISTAGVKTWVVRYTVNGKVRDYRFPKVYGVVSDNAHMSLADARGETKRADILPRIGAHQIRLLAEHDVRALLRASTARC